MVNAVKGMRIVLEPIFEAQFFAHSYGFRPMRDAPMALERTKELVFNTGYYWIVEGDISKCFDRIDHNILLKRLYHMGVQDKRGSSPEHFELVAYKFDVFLSDICYQRFFLG